MDYSQPGFSVMGFSRQEYWSGLPACLQGIFPTQGSNPHLLGLLHWQVDSLSLGPPRKTWIKLCPPPKKKLCSHKYWMGNKYPFFSGETLLERWWPMNQNKDPHITEGIFYHHVVRLPHICTVLSSLQNTFPLSEAIIVNSMLWTQNLNLRSLSDYFKVTHLLSDRTGIQTSWFNSKQNSFSNKVLKIVPNYWALTLCCALSYVPYSLKFS